MAGSVPCPSHPGWPAGADGAGAVPACLAVRVLWDMPVWPVWQLTGWVVDPHYLVRLQTFRQRGRRGQPGLAR